MDNLDPKPGYLTSEFWATVGTIVVSAVVSLAALFGHVLPKDNLVALIPTLAPIAAGIASAIYSLSRAKTKTSHYQTLVALNSPVPAVVSHGVVNVSTPATATAPYVPGPEGPGV